MTMQNNGNYAKWCKTASVSTSNMDENDILKIYAFFKNE
jgi:hypothetical protein